MKTVCPQSTILTLDLYFFPNYFSFCTPEFTIAQFHNEVFKSLYSTAILTVFKSCFSHLLAMYTWASMEEFYTSLFSSVRVFIIVPRVVGRQINVKHIAWCLAHNKDLMTNDKYPHHLYHHYHYMPGINLEVVGSKWLNIKVSIPKCQITQSIWIFPQNHLCIKIGQGWLNWYKMDLYNKLIDLELTKFDHGAKRDAVARSLLYLNATCTHPKVSACPCI